MIRAKCRVPKLSRHASGQAVVRLCGKDHYVGPFGSVEAQARYDALIAEWLARGRVLAPADDEGVSVNELVLSYWRQQVEPHYRKNGLPTSEQHCIKAALRFLKDAYDVTAVSEFGPLRLKAVREKMIAGGMSRRVVNRYVQKVRACFRWGTENELVPPSVFHGLQSVAGLKAGRSEARETEPVKPVPNVFVDAVLPFVSAQVKAMIELQRLTGMRPGEVCQLRACDIDVTGKVWIYRPQAFKGRSRPALGRKMIKACIQGVETIQNRVSLPRYFTADTLDATRKLAKMMSGEDFALEFASNGSAKTTLTDQAVKHIDELTKRAHLYVDFSTIEGRLEVVSVHEGKAIFIWETLTNRKIECRIGDEHFQAAQSLLGNRVRVTGRVSYRNHIPWLIHVEEPIRRLRTMSELPQPNDIGAINITGTLTSEEHVRRMRDA